MTHLCVLDSVDPAVRAHGRQQLRGVQACPSRVLSSYGKLMVTEQPFVIVDRDAPASLSGRRS
jgi:hypothetical protein